jgi:hypothetical protein
MLMVELYTLPGIAAEDRMMERRVGGSTMRYKPAEMSSSRRKI